MTIAGSIHFREILHLTVMVLELAATKFCCNSTELKVKGSLYNYEYNYCFIINVQTEVF